MLLKSAFFLKTHDLIALGAWPVVNIILNYTGYMMCMSVLSTSVTPGSNDVANMCSMLKPDNYKGVTSQPFQQPYSIEGERARKITKRLVQV